jgi:hypothetical protein
MGPKLASSRMCEVSIQSKIHQPGNSTRCLSVAGQVFHPAFADVEFFICAVQGSLAGKPAQGGTVAKKVRVCERLLPLAALAQAAIWHQKGFVINLKPLRFPSSQENFFLPSLLLTIHKKYKQHKHPRRHPDNGCLLSFPSLPR